MTKPPPPRDLRPIDRLLQIMAALRAPDGCPWDRQQTFADIVPYTLEEAYEVADAVRRNAMDDLCEELGDLLLQVVFHARMAEEAGHFTFDDVCRAIAEKMIARHPHVFTADNGTDGGAAADTHTDADTDADANTAAMRADAHTGWERIKAAERSRKGAVGDGALAGVARALPALVRAEKLSRRAARVGFTWPAAADVWADLEEELAELRAEIEAGADKERLQDELGDLLFVLTNLARLLGIDAEASLTGTNEKFIRRFNAMEESFAAEGKQLSSRSLDQLNARWDAVKRQQRS